MSVIDFVRRPRGVALAAVMLLALSFAQSALAETTIKAVLYSPLRLLDPVASSGYVTQYHAHMIYDTLFALDADKKVQPEMVGKYEVSPDKKVWTFTLRPGLKWHDGAPVRAADCVASIRRWAQQDKMGQVMMSFMGEMKALDDNTFQMVFKTANGLVLPALSKPLGPPYMMPKRIADTPANQPIKEHIGSGPFKFVESEFKPGLQAVYVKNKDYAPRSEPASGMAGNRMAQVDRVVFVSMPDQVTAINALMNGEIDYMQAMPYDLLPMVEGKAGIKVEIVDTDGQMTFYRFNFAQPPFNDKLVRQAAMAAIDRKAIMQALVGNPKYSKVCASIYGCQSSPFTTSAGTKALAKVDPSRTQELLKEAHFNGEPIVVLQPTDVPVLAAQPMVIAQSLRKAGMKVDLQASDFQTFLTRRVNAGPVNKGGWNLFATNLGSDDLYDPIRSLPVAANGPRAWPGWPGFPDIDALREKFALSTDLDEQKRIAAQIQERVLEEGVMVPVGQFFVPCAFSTRLTNVIHSSIPEFWAMGKLDQ